MPYYPPDIPFLAEGITEYNGMWHTGGNPSLQQIFAATHHDTSKIGNMSSIGHAQTGYNPGVDGMLYYEFTTPVDFSPWEYFAFSHYNEGYRTPPYDFGVRLVDINNNWSGTLNWTSSATWVDIGFLTSNFVVDAEVGFDLSQIKWIFFFGIADASDTWPKYHYVDWLYLYSEPAPPPKYGLNIYSTPPGKTFSIDGLTTQTPFERLVSPANYRITLIDTSGFDHWEPTFDVTTYLNVNIVDAAITVNAVYVDDGGGSNILPLLLIFGGITTVGLAAFVLLRKRSRKSRRRM